MEISMSTPASVPLNSDNIGMVSSTLCLIHCMATPFIFLVESCARACCASTPAWWKSIDLLFLFISSIAVYYAVKGTQKIWLKISFIAIWGALCLFVANEFLQFMTLPREMLYATTLPLILLHFYNKYYGQCHPACCPPKEATN